MVILASKYVYTNKSDDANIEVSSEELDQGLMDNLAMNDQVLSNGNIL